MFRRNRENIIISDWRINGRKKTISGLFCYVNLRAGGGRAQPPWGRRPDDDTPFDGSPQPLN
jgi:hypothetical protein